MNVDYQISSRSSHAICAVIALATTAVLMWLVFTVAGDYYVADAQAAAVATQTVAQADIPASSIVHVHP
ncbi:hypothetical protein ACL9RI_25060 [Janthinobacterium sp. Mn2066]|uniref:hypothetical protein n=1 Tax=Janthinobacterium sp. Mn2066 TaxID=3395264 RepID=UPI003BBBA5F8